MRSTLVSDAHMHAMGDASQRSLVDWLRSWPTDEWVLVGDMVDVWWGWDHAVFSAYLPFLAALREVAEETPVTWVRGNHDFALGRFVREDLGVVTSTSWSRQTAKGRVLAVHGDIAEPSRLQRAGDRLLRGRLGGFAARVAGPDRVWRLGNRLSQSSREHGQDSQQRVLDAQRAWVRGALDDANTVCTGHSHAPGVQALPGGQWVNLGDWVGHRSFATVHDEGVRLFRWHDGQAVPIEGEPSRRPWLKTP